MAQAAQASVAAPQFDIVRVNPQGGAVLAGRAPAGSEVILRASGAEIGRVKADAQGQWVLAGGPPLAPGTYEITLAARLPGGPEVAADGAVLVSVPAPAQLATAAPPPASTAMPSASVPAHGGVAQGGAAAGPIVLMTTPQGAPQLLQAPGRAAGSARLGLDVVDYDNAGEIRFAGTAPPGSTVRVYVDDAHVGDAVAGADGRWAMTPAARVAQGEHRLRLDQVDAAGRVAARVQLPFQRAVVAAAEPADARPGVVRVVVQPKQNLWRIARRAYGQGIRYTEIHAANRDVISDPNRIYPGQVFAIPAAGSTPTSARSSR